MLECSRHLTSQSLRQGKEDFGEQPAQLLPQRASSRVLPGILHIVILDMSLFFRPGRLLPLDQEEIPEHENVHLRAHETAVGVIGRLDNRLTANIEGRVYEYRVPGP